jgi:hypothetical protein
MDNQTKREIWIMTRPGTDYCRRIPKAPFAEYHRDRAWRSEIAATRDRGEKPSTELPSSMRPCVCGVTFDSHTPAQSYDHRRHIYAVQGAGGIIE